MSGALCIQSRGAMGRVLNSVPLGHSTKTTVRHEGNQTHVKTNERPLCAPCPCIGIAFLCLACMCVPHPRALGEEITTAAEGALRPNGLFCFQSNEDRVTKIDLVKLNHGKAEPIFTRVMPTAVKPPFCLSDAVIVVTTGGAINKFDEKGELFF